MLFFQNNTYYLICNNISFCRLENEKNPLVSIIILNYNAGNLLIDCVESILKTKYDNYEVIVVDNNSNDNSHIKCKEKFKQILLIQNSKNLGFCEGNNIGISHSKGEFVIILNPDTIVTEFWINEFLRTYNENGDGIYQPKILSLDDKETISSIGNEIQLFGFGFSKNKGNKIDNSSNKIEKITYASGACLFTKKEILEKIGMFDPFLFLYHDDLDLGWRGMLYNIDSFYIPTITVLHKESYNLKWSSKKFFWLERNRKYCILTHFSKDTRKKIFSELILTDLLVWGSYMIKGFLSVKIKAELDILKNKKKIEERYLEIEKKKMVSDLEIINRFSDEIWIPKVIGNGVGSKYFNIVLKKLSISARKKLKVRS